jgi:heme oxygenase
LSAQAHERVDAAFGRFSLTDPSGYRYFLQAHGAVFPVCERALAASGAADLLADWPSRVRSPALLADLETVGAAPGPEIPDLPPLSPASAFGMMYVLEGSRLGGAVLARRLLTNPDERCRNASRYLLHGEGLRLWPNFVAAMEASPHVAQDPQSVIDSALRTFGLFEAAAINTRDTI